MPTQRNDYKNFRKIQHKTAAVQLLAFDVPILRPCWGHRPGALDVFWRIHLQLHGATVTRLLIVIEHTFPWLHSVIANIRRDADIVVRIDCVLFFRRLPLHS